MPFGPLQLGIDRRHVINRYGGMVLDLADLATGREKLVEMAMPASGILSRAQTLHLGPIQDTLNAAPEAKRRIEIA